jgi:hypothetical protein
MTEIPVFAFGRRINSQEASPLSTPPVTKPENRPEAEPIKPKADVGTWEPVYDMKAAYAIRHEWIELAEGQWKCMPIVYELTEHVLADGVNGRNTSVRRTVVKQVSNPGSCSVASCTPDKSYASRGLS